MIMLIAEGITILRLGRKDYKKAERIKLNQKLDMLENSGPNLTTGLLSDSKLSHIKKIRIKGRVAIRLMLCKGPIDNKKEFTLLFGAIEKDNKLTPKDAEQRAETRRQEIIQAPNSRRCLHERVGY
jgi:hypothetical protein